MNEYGSMPSKNQIAAKTELSRQTVHKHLKEYTSDPRFLEQIEQFRFMTSKVLAKVYQFAINGDMRAAKLYFEVVGNLSANPTVVNTQNNYIQINEFKLTQESIKQLKPEQLQRVEDLLKQMVSN